MAGSNKLYTGLHVQSLIIFSDFNELWVFWTDFDESLSSGTQMIHADRQTDKTDRRTGMMKALGAFRAYAKASKKRPVSAVQESSL